MEYLTNHGWLPSPNKTEQDKPDWTIEALSMPLAATLPERASLETFVERIDNQLSKPWCVAFGTVNPIEYAMKMHGLPVPKGGFSKAFMYAMCKKYDGIPLTDGTYIRVAFEVAAKYGLCPDSLCPTATYLQLDHLPVITNQMLSEAYKYRIKAYARLQDYQGYADLAQIKQVIANKGFVVIGSWVEQDNWLDGDDLITVPKGDILGGHCTFLFDFDNQYIRSGITGFTGDGNSWGEGWGDRGKAHMSYEYMKWKTADTRQPCLSEAWAFTVGGTLITPKIYNMPVAPVYVEPGYTMLPFRAIYEALGGQVRWYRNTEEKIVAVAEVALKGKTVTIEAVQDSTELKIYERSE